MLFFRLPFILYVLQLLGRNGFCKRFNITIMILPNKRNSPRTNLGLCYSFQPLIVSANPPSQMFGRVLNASVGKFAPEVFSNLKNFAKIHEKRLY